MYNTRIPHPACLGGQYFFVPTCPWIVMGQVVGWCQFTVEKYKSEAIVWEDKRDKRCMWKENAGRAYGTRNVPFLKKCNYSSELGLTKISYQFLTASQIGGSFLWDLIYVLKEGTGCHVCTFDLSFSPLKTRKKSCVLRNVTVHF